MFRISAEAQNRFGQLLDAAQRNPITIELFGCRIAVFLAKQNYGAMQHEREDRSGASVAGHKTIAILRGSRHIDTFTRFFTDRRAELNAEIDL